MQTMQHYLDLTKDYLSTKNNGTILKAINQEVAKELNLLEIPNRKVEDWKYTNLSRYLEKNYTYQAESTQVTQVDQSKDFIHVYFNNGVLDHSNSQLDELKIEPIQNIDQDLFNRFEMDHYFKNDFAHIMNMGHMSLGNVFKLSAKTVISKPVIFHHSFSGDLSLHNITNFYFFDDSCQVSILERFDSSADVAVNFETNCLIAANAQVEHVQLQAMNKQALFINALNSQVHKDAVYNNIIINTGALVSRTNLYLNLCEAGANASAHGLYSLNSNQHHDTMSYIRHLAPHTESHQLYKGILDDQSRGIFTGRVRVERDAQLISANQLNKNLLLSKKAHANSRPQMEIYADDVKCAHGSTTGQLSDVELFYFEARGIRPDKARQMLAKGFAFDVTLKIQNQSVRNYINRHIFTNNEKTTTS